MQAIGEEKKNNLARTRIFLRRSKNKVVVIRTEFELHYTTFKNININYIFKRFICIHITFSLFPTQHIFYS